MTKLIFLGDGSAFNYNSHNTSAYLMAKNDLILFDCGEAICNQLLKLHILEKAERIFVFITHLHSDHIGSLEALLYYNQKFLHKDFRIFYPRTARLKQLLKLTGVDFPFEIYSIPEQLSGFNIECVTQKHIPFSYGYFFYGESSFFYSGDTCEVNSRAIKKLKSGEIDMIYHEVTLSSSPIHTHLEKLKRAFPMELRKNVCLMHFDNDDCKEACKKEGFAVCEVVE